MTKKNTYEVHNPHDAFFKQFLAKAEIAEDFLRHHLPSDVVEQVALATLALQKDSFIDVDLQEHFSDLLYRALLKNGDMSYSNCCAIRCVSGKNS